MQLLIVRLGLTKGLEARLTRYTTKPDKQAIGHLPILNFMDLPLRQHGEWATRTRVEEPTGGVDLTFATRLPTNEASECQIQTPPEI